MRIKIASAMVVMVLMAMLAGCGGSGEQAADGMPPPAIGGDTLEIGPMVVQTEKTAGFKAESLAANADCVFVALYGAQINYLASTAMLDRVVFSRNENIFRCNLDGSGLTQLTNNNAEERWPRWSPDGTRIAFQRQWSGDKTIICTMNANGTGTAALTSNAHLSQAPDWSPDGRRIAFERGLEPFSDVCIMNAEGPPDELNLTNTPGVWDRTPAWSQDGATLAFCTDRYTGYEIATINEFDRIVTRLTTDGGIKAAVTWSPCGTQLAYDHNAPGRVYRDIVTMDNTGGSQRNLTSSSTHDVRPRYSSDGRYIAFQRAGAMVWINETESPYRAWKILDNADYPDLGSPILQTDRVLIGGYGADRFGNDPVYPNAPAVIVAYGDEGYRNLVRIGVATGHLGSMQIKPLPNAGSTSVAVEVSATRVANLRQDAGLGLPATLWDFNAFDAGMALLHFNGSTGKLVSVTVVRDVVYPSDAGSDQAAYTSSVQGDSLLLTGDFPAVFDAEGNNLAPDGGSSVRLGSDGQVLAVN